CRGHWSVRAEAESGTETGSGSVSDLFRFGLGRGLSLRLGRCRFPFLSRSCSPHSTPSHLDRRVPMSVDQRQLLRCAPYFPVADVDRSAEHSERVLGFRREYVGGSPPVFAILSRDGLGIMLRLVDAPE